MRVVYIGFLKTASRSICKFCKDILGYEMYQGNKPNIHSSHTDMIYNCFVVDGNDMCTTFHEGYVKNKKIYDFIDKHENLITREFPYFGMYEYINEKYDDTKFIMCLRDPDETFESYMKYMNAHGSMAFKINKALLGINEYICEDDRELFKKVYIEHNNKIIKFFKDKPGKLLLLNFNEIDSGIFEEKISIFLGKENSQGLKLNNLRSHCE